MTMDENPASQLATLVVERLIKDGFLRPEKREQLIARVAAGEMKEGDWNLEIDLSGWKATEK